MAEATAATARGADPAATDVSVGHLLADSTMGGAENYVILLANEHAARGGRSHVIVLNRPGPISARFDPRVQVSYLGYRRASIRNPLRFAASVLRGYRVLARTVRAHGIQVLQTHLPDTNLWGLVLSLRGVCRVVITIHNNKFLRNVGRRGVLWKLKLAAYRAMLRRCGAVVAVTGEVRRSLLETLGVGEADAGRVAVVDNGVPVPAPPGPAERERRRAARGVAPDDLWVLAAGRLTEAKNFACLVRAAALLQRRGLPLRVTIAGEGELRGELERQIDALGTGGAVELVGNIDDLGEVMTAADLLAMPSRWEGLPLTLLEALARGLPVVGTRINGLRDVVQEGVHGLLVPVDDDAALAEAIAGLAADPERRRRLGANCLALAREKYDFQRVYADLADVYRQVATRGALGA